MNTKAARHDEDVAVIELCEKIIALCKPHWRLSATQAQAERTQRLAEARVAKYRRWLAKRALTPWTVER